MYVAIKVTHHPAPQASNLAQCGFIQLTAACSLVNDLQSSFITFDCCAYTLIMGQADDEENNLGGTQMISANPQLENKVSVPLATESLQGYFTNLISMCGSKIKHV